MKMPVGAPTKYKPKYCKLVVDFCNQGQSLVEFASHIGVSRQSIQQWRQNHQEFYIACDIALSNIQAYYERLQRMNTIGHCPVGKDGKKYKINHQALTFTLSRQFRDWKERTTIEHSGVDGAPIQHMDLSKLSNEKLRELEQIAKLVTPSDNQK